jgi:hypothetical protein
LTKLERERETEENYIPLTQITNKIEKFGGGNDRNKDFGKKKMDK